MGRMRFRLYSCFFILLCTSLHAQYNSARYPIIPQPQTLLALGDNFEFSRAVTIVTEDKSARKECDFFRRQVAQLYDIHLRYGKMSGSEPCIFISLDSLDLPPEGYEMFITKEGINLYGSRAGVFYGLQTILQLIQPNPNGNGLMIPSCSIIDYPRFSWRGMHLDVSRHFFSTSNVKEYLRWMAMYKLNTFHWHLTDDQGWRIEIKKYPLLTSVGAWRNATLVGHYSETPDRYDSTRYGGYYTQQEIKEVLRLADSLHITVVPEIEMPGHASALLTAYPNLGCSHTAQYKVEGTWGVFTHVLCPNDETFTTLYGILDEVVALFPGKYIHIGGDECPKDEWKVNSRCQQLINELHIENENALQSWFVQKIVTYLGTKGKKAIGWDEILEGAPIAIGVADTVAIMSWRGEEGGIAAAKAHHKVVMTPGGFCYFDHYQSQNVNEPLAIGGYLPIEKVYSYDPVPASLSSEEKQYIMGVQANLWTEYIPTFSQVQYMIFPRIAALAEVAWSRTSVKDFETFVPRVTAHMQLYDKMHINYSRALFELQPTYSPSPDGNGILVSFTTKMPYADIRYGWGNFLTLGDSIYYHPVQVRGTTTLNASVFLGEERYGTEYKQNFTGHLAFGRSVTLRKQPAPAYNHGGTMTLTDGITGRTPWTGSEWLGWWGDTLDAVIDLGKTDTVHSIFPVFLEDAGSWIYFPTDVDYEFSLDGKIWFKPDPQHFHPRDAQWGHQFKYYSDEGIVARYVRVTAQPWEKISEGNPGAGYPAWVFVSEIIVM